MRLETQYKRNILKTWRQVTMEDVREGVNWYPAAHEIARSVGKGDVVKGAGVIAAFSPMVKWSLNVEMARNATTSGQFVGHFAANNDKAKRIWEGADPLKVLGGNKVRAFYRCILNAGQCEVPVIDRHAVAVALNRIVSDRERTMFSRNRHYDAVAKAYQEVAQSLTIPVAILQAITWVNWRRRRGMVD